MKHALSAALGFGMTIVCAPVQGAADPSGCVLSALNAMERVCQHQIPAGQPAVTIQAARNEIESFQVAVAAPKTSITVTAAAASDLVGPKGARIAKERLRVYREEYVRVRLSTPDAPLPPGLYPDPLVPLIDPATGKPIEPLTRHQERWGEPATMRGHDIWGVPFDVFAGQNQALWIDAHVPEDAVPGEYRGTFEVRCRDRSVARIPITLTVWGFTLPAGPTHANHFGGFGGLSRTFDAERDSDRVREIELRYCRALAEHRLNPPIPGHLLPRTNPDGSLEIAPDRHAALRRFMDELHVTDFEVPRAPFARLPHSTTRPGYADIPAGERAKAQRYYREFWAYLKSNGWEKRAYLYMLDEPNTRENYEQVLALGRLVAEGAPQLRRLVVEQTFAQDPSWPDIDPAVDIWCPLWAYIDRDTITRKIAAGDAVWSYTALVQRAPRCHPEYDAVKDKDPPHWHIDWPLPVYRVPPWINRQYGITGLLYWSTVTQVIAPWFNPAFAHPRHFNGGGFLFYPGTPCGIDGPIASIRLKNIRDGMEDYEYFALLEKRAGPDALRPWIDRVAPNWWDYARDPETILDARRRIAERIAAAQ